MWHGLHHPVQGAPLVRWLQQAQHAAHRCQQQQECRAAHQLGLLTAAQCFLEGELVMPQGCPPLTPACCRPHPGQFPSPQGCDRPLRLGQAADPRSGHGRPAASGPSAAAAAARVPSQSPWAPVLQAALLSLRPLVWARPKRRQQLPPRGAVYPCRAALAEEEWLAGLSWEKQRAPAPAAGAPEL